MKRSSSASRICWAIDAWGAGACVVLTIVAYVFGVAPLRQRHAELLDRRAQLSRKMQEATESAATMRLFAGRLTTLQRKLADLPLKLEPSNRLNQRLAEVTAAAGECGLDVNDIRPGNPISGTRHTLVPIDLAGSGSYGNCVDFLNRFHDKFADSGIASFAMARNLSDPASETSFYFKLIWYVEPQQTSAAIVR